MIAETFFLAEIKYRIGAQMFRDHGPRDRNCCGGGARPGITARNVPDAGFRRRPRRQDSGRLAKINSSKRHWVYGCKSRSAGKRLAAEREILAGLAPPQQYHG